MSNLFGPLIVSFKRSLSPDLLYEFLHFRENGSVLLSQIKNPRIDEEGYRAENLVFEEGIELAAEWLKSDKSITATFEGIYGLRQVQTITL